MNKGTIDSVLIGALFFFVNVPTRLRIKGFNEKESKLVLSCGKIIHLAIKLRKRVTKKKKTQATIGEAEKLRM